MNPLHRIRNRIAAGILEDRWTGNYEANKELLLKSYPFEKCRMPQTNAALIIGAGPSLSKNLANIHKLPLDRMTVFCCDKAYRQFLKEYTPHVVTALNARNPDLHQWFWDLPTAASTLLAPVTADPDTFKHWNGPKCCVHCALPVDLTDRIRTETGIGGVNGGSNVGVFSYLMAGRLEFPYILMVGMDYSFRSKDEALALKKKDEPYMVMEFTDPNKEPRWTTWDWFDSAIAFFEYARFFQRNRGIRTLNLTDGGILYDGEYIEDMNITDALREIE